MRIKVQICMTTSFLDCQSLWLGDKWVNLYPQLKKKNHDRYHSQSKVEFSIFSHVVFPSCLRYFQKLKRNAQICSDRLFLEKFRYAAHVLNKQRGHDENNRSQTSVAFTSTIFESKMRLEGPNLVHDIFLGYMKLSILTSKFESVVTEQRTILK